MVDFRSRDQAPLGDETWKTIDETVNRVASGQLVGRRVVNVFGPLGPGVQTVATDVFLGAGKGTVDLSGDTEVDPIRAERRKDVPVPLVYKDFALHWRDLESHHQFRMPLDVSPFAAAASFCAAAEDDLIFNGNKKLGYEGLLNVDGRLTRKMGDWTENGKTYDDVVGATQQLVEAGFYGPYALIVSPRLFAGMHRTYANTGVLEMEQIRKIATHGVYQLGILPEPSAMVISVGAQNLELAVAQDMTTAFLETRNLNHYFRVLESIALHIHRPDAIVTIEGPAAGGGGNGRKRR